MKSSNLIIRDNLDDMKGIYPDNVDLGNSLKSSTTSNFDLDFTHLLNEINHLIKNDLSIDEFTKQTFVQIKNYLNFETFLVLFYEREKILFKCSNDSDNNLSNYLNDFGIIRLVVQEKKSLFIAEPDCNSNASIKNLLIVPVIFSVSSFVIFCLKMDKDRNEVFNKNFSIFETIFNLAGYNIISKIVYDDNNRLIEDLKDREKELEQNIGLALAGKISLKSFHSLKNKTQIIISSFNLLQKFFSFNDEKFNKIFSILNNEIPNFSKSIKTISEVSKNITSEKSPVYLEVDKLLYEITDLLNLTDSGNKLKIEFNNITHSKIFGNYEKLLQGFLLLLFELIDHGIDKIKISNIEDAFRVTLIFNFNVPVNNFLCNLFEDSSNFKFVQIKNLFKSNYINILTKCSTENVEILISIPKRSSQFKSRKNLYVQNFDS